MSDLLTDHLVATFLGGLLGIATGLLPGIHVNTVALLIVGWTGHSLFLSLLIGSLAISHTCWETIPSTLLGAPTEGTALTVLPGHRLLLHGRGYEAIWLLVAGGVGGMCLTLLCFPLLLLIIPFFYHVLLIPLGSVVVMVWVLALMVGVLLATERSPLRASVVFLLSGVLGSLALDFPDLHAEEAFFPLFTGLFGTSNLLMSVKDRGHIPPQTTACTPLTSWSLVAMLKGIVGGILVGTLPGVGSSHAATVLHTFTRRRDEREFLISIGAINTITALFSLVSLYTILQPRSGAAVAIQTLLPLFGLRELLLIVGAASITVGVMSVLVLRFTPVFLRVLHHLPYRVSSLTVLVFLVILTGVLTHEAGLLILFTATAIGLLPLLWRVKHSCAMGVLLLPVLLFYMGVW